METNLTGEVRPEVDREEYARYEAYLEQRFRDSSYTAMYRARFQARKDAKVAREEAAKAEASNTNQSLPAASQENALSDGEDPLQAWKPRKHRQNKEPLNEASSTPSLPSGLKDVEDVRHRVNNLPSTTRSPSKIVSVSSKPASNEVTTTGISGRAAPFEATPYSRRSSSASETLPSRPKRSAASSFNEDDRPGVSKQRRRSSTLSNAEVIEQPLARRTGFNRQPPKWYKELPKPNNTRDASKSAEETMLFRIKEAMRTAKASNAQNRAVVLPSKFGELINMLHKIVFLPVSDKLLRKTRMLDNADGLPQLFDSEFAGGIAWPWYLRADAEELYNKWCGQVFETDLYRGLNRAMGGKGKGNSSTSDTLDDTYRHYRLVNPKEHGNGLLINGTWWPTQLAVLRDGGHGSSQGGITSHPKEGAFSVIMAGGLDPKNKPYPNIDRGDEVLYCGTDNPSTDLNEPSRDTKAMILNNENGHPVRLFRSSNLVSKYAPELGFRYDGLYSVVDFEILDPPEEKRKRHRFKLVRCEGQDPIRSDGPEKRPTKEEIQEYEKDKKNRGR